MSLIHSTAIIDPKAQLDSHVKVGPYAIIGADVVIGADTEIAAHVVIQGPTQIGARNKIFQFASIGEAPQHLDYQGEPTTLVIGNDNVIREYCSMHRGSTHPGYGETRVGDHNYFMNYTHVAHDCTVGNHNIFANNAGLAGHVQVDDFVILGAFAGVHQFCKIGSYSFLGRATKVVKDILPYMMVAGNPGAPCGLNLVGLKRNGFSNDTLRQLKKAYRALYRQGFGLDEAVAQISTMADDPAVANLLQAIDASSRGIARV